MLVIIFTFVRNLVLALNQVSIRGDFRTTVEYLIKLLEADEFISNDISTVWLDKLIAGRVQVNRMFKLCFCLFCRTFTCFRVRNQTLWWLLWLHHCMLLIQRFRNVLVSMSTHLHGTLAVAINVLYYIVWLSHLMQGSSYECSPFDIWNRC